MRFLHADPFILVYTVGPNYTPATTGNIGNLVALGTSLPGGKNFAREIDASAVFEMQVTCHSRLGSNATAPVGVRFDFYHQVGTKTNLTASASAGATSLAVASANGIEINQSICVWDATNGGEMVTVTGVSGLSLTCNATRLAHTSSAEVYIIEQIPSLSVQPAPIGAYVANTVYSKTVRLDTSVWVCVANNTDSTTAVTIGLTHDDVSSVG
jgi:hypothetical protein